MFFDVISFPLRKPACLQGLQELGEVGQVEDLGLGLLEELEVLHAGRFGDLARLEVLAAE